MGIDPLGVGRGRWLRSARKLLALLERERRLLRSGALREAADLAPEKERLSTDLANPPQSAGEEARSIARDLQVGATRNRMLLGACIDAVRAARVRIAQIERARNELGVYDKSGMRPVAPSGGTTRDSRA
ncbi:MAG: hypothetical protein ACJAVR_003150 [Paracoccaceae bacterium]|jgi:hypothetical protein